MLIVVWAALQAPLPAAPSSTHTDGQGPPAVQIIRVKRGPTLDGRLQEAFWATAPAITQLVQTDPDEGQPVSESTVVHLVYDGAALYVGARLFDRDPAGIARQMARRDVPAPSDEFRILLDTYHDHRTAFQFAVTAAGVRLDEVIGDDGAYEDNSWDPVWQAVTTVDSLGWTAEIRIPFSQLRFSAASKQVWGIRVVRWIERKQELALFPFVPKTKSGVASRFANLVGLHDITDRDRTELLPYVVTRGEFHQPDHPGNPLDDGRSMFQGAGMDIKAGVTPALTLDVTANPDFGQVELDPAFVNLTEFEQRLDEHRPFFVEGSSIFRFGSTGGGLNKFSDSPSYFYSRRIGRPPQGTVKTSSSQFKSIPANTTILGAAKLSGKTASGWSIGLLEALTAREYGTVVDTLTHVRRQDEVEPFTSYFIGRVKRDYSGGATTLGFLTTAVHRDLSRPTMDFLNSAAYTGALDFTHRWKDRTYTFAASLGGSYIKGDTTAINAAQRSSARYFQRPDARSFHYDDSSRTALSGMSGDVYLNKTQGNWVWGVAGRAASPGFEVNDLGFKNRVDQLSVAATGGRRWTTPGRVFREANLRLSSSIDWNYDGDVIGRSVGVYGDGQFRNFWRADANLSYDARVLDDRLTRGGPLAQRPAGWSAYGEAYTDDRKAISAYAYLSYSRDAAGSWYLSAVPQLTYRPSKSLSTSLSIGYESGLEIAQYVQRETDPTATATLGTRYVFAALRERSAYLKLRINATFTRTVTFQLFAQPFTFLGDYSGFKELAAPRSYAFIRYGQDNGSTIAPDGNDYTVDPDGPGPAPAFWLYNPDFRSRSFRLNAVWRWEYRPGSTLYLVWSQTRAGYFSSASDPLAPDLRQAVFLDRPTNVLMLKVNYWLRQ